MNYATILKVEYYKKLCFNHNHWPKGTPVGGEFTSAYYPALDTKGNPIKNKHGKSLIN